MYDSRSEAREFVGMSEAEAVSKACAFFGTDEASLRISAPDAGEVYGLSSRAVIVAIPADAAARRPSGPRSAGPREDGPRRGGRDRERGGDRDRGSDRDRGRGRGGRESRDGGREPRRESEPRLAEAPARFEDEEAPAGPSVGTARSPLGEAGDFVNGLVERLDLGSFEISESEDGELVIVQLRGPAAERLSGGDGRAVDAVQFLVNQVALRQNERARRVVVDAEGEPERREGHLTRLAERAAERARETGRAVALDPMNPRDRRVIHVALRDAATVATMSVGAGRYRQVVVVPEGAPEYEQARRQAAESASRENG